MVNKVRSQNLDLIRWMKGGNENTYEELSHDSKIALKDFLYTLKKNKKYQINLGSRARPY